MINLKTNKCHTKHVDTRYHWIRQFVDNEIVDVKYIKSEDNVLDIYTKNLPAKLYKKHSSKLISDVSYFVRCNTTKFPKKKIPWWWSRSNKKVRRRMYLGFIHEVSTEIPFVGRNRKRYREILW